MFDTILRNGAYNKKRSRPKRQNIGRLLSLENFNTESDSHFPYFYFKAINTLKHSASFLLDHIQPLTLKKRCWYSLDRLKVAQTPKLSLRVKNGFRFVNRLFVLWGVVVLFRVFYCATDGRGNAPFVHHLEPHIKSRCAPSFDMRTYALYKPLNPDRP